MSRNSNVNKNATGGDERGWKVSFEAASDEQLKTEMAATPKQRLEALEALIEFAHQAGALPKGR